MGSATTGSKMRSRLSLALTLDIDPDSNRAVRGRTDAISYPLERGLVRVDAAHRGLMETFHLLEYLNIPATLFFEARTAQLIAEKEADIRSLTASHEIGCHSHKHEDFLGITSGVPIPRTQAEDIISRSMDILSDVFGREVTGFRAPYLRINQEFLSLLGEMGFQYDSSIISDCIRPFYTNHSSLWELTIASLRSDSGRRITSYLHYLFEGKRDVEEYVWTVASLAYRVRGGLFILAFHPWELFVTSSGRVLSTEDSLKRLERLGDILQKLKAAPNLEFVTLRQYLEGLKENSLGQPQVHEVRV